MIKIRFLLPKMVIFDKNKKDYAKINRKIAMSFYGK